MNDRLCGYCTRMVVFLALCVGIPLALVPFALAAPLAPIQLGDRPNEKAKPTDGDSKTSTPINFEIKGDARVSLAVYEKKTGSMVRCLLRGERLKAGEHSVVWDGLTRRGKLVDPGTYEWRLVQTPGFTARYLTTIGINPPGGEHPQPRYSWVGDHVGAGIVDVDETGVYVGSPMTEGMMMLVKADPTMSKILWRRPQFYQSGQLRRVATSGEHAYMLHPNGKLRRVNKDNGGIEAEWQIGWEGKAPSDVDTHGKNLVVTYPDKNTIRWLAHTNGSVQGEAKLEGVSNVAAIGNVEKGEAVVAAARALYVVTPSAEPRKVATLDGEVTAMDYDPGRKELWVVIAGHKVLRLDSKFATQQAYSEKPREQGPFDPTRFSGVNDIAADLKGGFYIGEPGVGPRRLAHMARDGSLINQWFGGMSFYINAVVDPGDPTRLFGIAPEGWINVYKIDYDAGTWELEATYHAGNLGDSLFPFATSYKAVRKNGELFLYHRVVPSVIKLDEKRRRVVPVAIAGRVVNQGRTFFQFAGSGREGYPKPWVAAAEHHGFKDLKKAPTLFSWADTDGDGEFDPQEFVFYADAKHSASFHNAGDFEADGDYLAAGGVNAPHAFVRLPLVAWEGPGKTAPRWDWNKAEPTGTITANSYAYGSPRNVSIASDGSAYVAYQAGLMIAGHGQYEGGGWPESAPRGSRVLAFDPEYKTKFVVGRQSKDGREASTGVLYYPMQVAAGPKDSVIVNDQTKQPAQAWTHDGLYLGGFFDHRTEDGRHGGFYHIHGDDNQGVTVITTKQGKTYWLMPYVGHNRLYEITGWDKIERQSGDVERAADAAAPAQKGKGLTAKYFVNGKVALEATEAPIYHEKFAGDRHAGKIAAPFKAVWSGYVEPKVSDRYQFISFLGRGEQVAVWIDGKLVYAAGVPKGTNPYFPLTAGRRHRIRVEYNNPDGRAMLKLLWRGPFVDRGAMPVESLYPESS